MGDMERAEAEACLADTIIDGRADLVEFFKAEGLACHCGKVDYTLV